MRSLKISAALLLTAGVSAPAFAEDPVLCAGLTPTITATAPGVVQGTSGNDVILVNASATGATSAPSIVLADAGDDVICLGSNLLNVVIGGAGTDTVSYEHSIQSVVASMNTVAVRFKYDLGDPLNPSTLVSQLITLSPGADLLPQTEKLIGSPQMDVLIGNILEADEIHGGAGDDVIVGLFGDDMLFGEAGNDVIIGDGYDEVTYELVAGFDVGPIAVPRLATDNDLLDGGDGDDGLNDDSGNNRFIGGAGNDSVAQGYGNDVLDGGPGTDQAYYAQRAAKVDLRTSLTQDTGHGIDSLTGIEDLVGSGQDDTLIGVSGVRNILRAQAGNDLIAGGSKTGDVTGNTLDGGGGDDGCFGATQLNCETTWLPPNPPTTAVPVPPGEEPPSGLPGPGDLPELPSPSGLPTPGELPEVPEVPDPSGLPTLPPAPEPTVPPLP